MSEHTHPTATNALLELHEADRQRGINPVEVVITPPPPAPPAPPSMRELIQPADWEAEEAERLARERERLDRERTKLVQAELARLTEPERADPPASAKRKRWRG